jgi:SOS-response transcriptional repressor LexA
MAVFNKLQFSELLLKAKGDRSLYQYALDANLDRGYLSRIVNMKRDLPPSAEIIKRLATAAENNIKYADLMIAAGYMQKPRKFDILQGRYFLLHRPTPEPLDFTKSYREILNNCIRVAVYNETSLKSNCISDTKPVTYRFIDKSDLQEDLHFYYIVNDDAMINSRIQSGDMALIRKDTRFCNRDIVLVKLDNGDLVLRRFFIDKSLVLFISDNLNYLPIVYDKGDIASGKIKVIGKVVHIQFKL